jgi:carotenoid 1,2-hydratase
MNTALDIYSSFDAPVAEGGYTWWYLDALSDDGRYGITIIAFIGSVFSPYYAWARNQSKGLADPANHCAMNIALYASRETGAPHGWSMTERGQKALQRSRSNLNIGRSSMHWENGVLTVTMDERTAPWGRRFRGALQLHPAATLSRGYALDSAGHHQWCPIAPCARIELEMDQPKLKWSGSGYFDTNRGERPLEQDFTHWNWSRTAMSKQRTAVLYDAARADGSNLSLALKFDAAGRVEEFEAPPTVDLPPTGWRMGRSTRSEEPAKALVEQELEDAPFYSRSVIRTRLLGETGKSMHESLSLQRWKKPVVQLMLPFRMPRRA